MVVHQKQTEALLWLAQSLSSSQAPAVTAAPNSPLANLLVGTGVDGCTASDATLALAKPTTACGGTLAVVQPSVAMGCAKTHPAAAAAVLTPSVNPHQFQLQHTRKSVFFFVFNKEHRVGTTPAFP